MKKLQTIPEQLFLILSLFTVTFFVYRDFGIRMIFGFGVLGLILCWNFAARVICGQRLQPTCVRGAMLWLAAVVLLNFLRPDSRHNADTVSYVISMGVCIGFLWLWQENDRECSQCLRLLLAAAVAMTGFVLLCRIFPEHAHALLYPHISPVAQNYFDYFLPRGYGIALGGYTFTDYIIFCGIAVCWGRIAARQWSWHSAGNLVMIFIFGFAILSIGRRGELLMAFVLCVLMVLMLCSPKVRLRLILGGSAAAGVLLWLFLHFLPQLREIDILHRYVSTIDNLLSGHDITSGRLTLYLLAIQAFREHPILGIGFDQFHTLVNPQFTDIEGNVMQDAHNIYLQMLCETGLVGTVLTLLPMIWLLVTTARCLRAARQREDRRGAAPLTTSLLIQSYLLSLGLIDPTFQKIVFWCFYAIAAMLLVCGMDQSGWRPQGRLSALFDRTAGLLTAVLGRFRREKAK